MMKTTKAYELHRLSVVKSMLAEQLHQAEDEQERSAIKQQLEQTHNDLRKLHSPDGEPVVSEHAIIRWLERVKGIDLNQIRAEILEGRSSQIRQLGSCNFKLPNGMKMVVRGHVVVTILDKQQQAGDVK